MSTLKQLLEAAGGPVLAVNSDGIYFLCQQSVNYDFCQGLKMEKDISNPNSFRSLGTALFPGSQSDWQAV